MAIPTDTDLAAYGFAPTEPYPGSTTRWRLRCIVCQRASRVLWKSVRNGTPCRWCKWESWRGLALRGSPDRTSDRDEITVMLATQSLVLLGDLPYDSLCPTWAACTICGDDEVVVPSRVAGGVERGWDGCTSCYYADRRHIREDGPELFARHGLELLDGPTESRWIGRSCRCLTCGAPRTISLSALDAGAPPCRVCHGSVDPRAAHRVYLIRFPDLGVIKVGITHARDDRRLNDHRSAGGTLLDLIDTPDRPTALLVERMALTTQARWAVTGDPRDWTQGGWTELWADSAPKISLLELAARAAQIPLPPPPDDAPAAMPG